MQTYSTFNTWDIANLSDWDGEAWYINDDYPRKYIYSHDIKLYEFFDTTKTGAFNVYGSYQRGQQFTIGTIMENEDFVLSHVEVNFFMTSAATATGTVNVSVYTINGSGHPDTLLYYGTIAQEDIRSNTTYSWHMVPMTGDTILENGTKYVVVIKAPDANYSNRINVAARAGGNHYDGGDLLYSTNGGSSWTSSGTDDMYFRIYGQLDCVVYAPVLVGPSNNSIRRSVFLLYLNVTVSNSGRYPMTVTFHWSNGTLIDNNTYNGTLSVTSGTTTAYLIGRTNNGNTTEAWLDHNTTYNWYVNATYGDVTTKSDVWNFTTGRAYDINNDGTTDYLDASSLVSVYGESGFVPGKLPQDLNEDGVVGVGDVSVLLSYYGVDY